MAKKKKQSMKSSSLKLLFIMVLFAIIWTALLGRAAWLQLYQGPELRQLALRQHLAAELERGERGRIYDRNGNLLATSVEAESVYLRPVKVVNVNDTAAKLSEIVGISRSILRKKLSSKRNFIWIKRQVDDRVAAKIRQADLPGVYLTKEFARLYPNNHLAGQLIGFVGVDGKGLEGIEKKMNFRLTGKKAQFVVQRDASGRRLYLDASGHEVNTRGEDVRLTIDAHLQAITENALVEAVKKNSGRWGSAVVVDVASGDILALANCPRFNPNTFRKSSPKIWRDHAVLDVVEPGSTMKPVLFAAALEHGVITPEKLYDCEGGRWKINGQYIRDTHRYHWLPAHKILRYSSNIGSAKIGMELGVQNYYNFLRDIGFGSSTDLGVPGERDGSIRPPSQWNEFDLAAASFGQGIGVTAVQMAKAFLCIANKGVVKPLRLIIDEDQQKTTPRRLFSEKTADTVLSMMREVVQLDGTGQRARIPGITVAGKTGTAQKATRNGRGYGQEHLASFVGMIPGDNPQYLVVVMVDDPRPNHYGGVVAAPAVKQIMVRSLAYFGKLPEGEEKHSDPVLAALGKEPMPRQAVKAADPSILAAGKTMPDLTGMPLRRAVEVLVRKGFVPQIRGKGMTVNKQLPEAGKEWPQKAGDKITLWLS
jgi:cell division protein FtsI (penicillin-binding protein 3)